MKELWGAEKLEAELEAAKDGLRGLEKNIRKILGRDVPEGENDTTPIASNRIAQKRPLQDDARGRRQGPDFQNNGFGAKRRWQQGGGAAAGGGINNNNTEPKTVFSRLSARVASTADDSDNEDDNAFKPAVSSRVIATPREIPSRQDVIRRESTDERSKQRNRRMFGALLGTLQKFRQEETKLKAKEDKKAEVEARVEEAKRREREELKRERQQLFLNRKQQLAQVKALEAKLARSKQYQEWRSGQIPLLNFIKTKTQPPIYYLPKRSTPETDKLIEESAKELKAEIDRREKILLDDLEMIQSQVGNKNLHDKSNENLDQSMEEPEEEENRDPNPEKNGDIEMEEGNKSIGSDNKAKKSSSKDKEQSNEENKHDDKVEDKEVDRYENMEEDKEEEGDEDKEDGKEENTRESRESSREKIQKEIKEENLEESKNESKDERRDDSTEENKDKSIDNSGEENEDTSKDEDKIDSQIIENDSSQLDREENNISIQEQDEKMSESTD